MAVQELRASLQNSKGFCFHHCWPEISRPIDLVNYLKSAFRLGFHSLDGFQIEQTPQNGEIPPWTEYNWTVAQFEITDISPILQYISEILFQLAILQICLKVISLNYLTHCASRIGTCIHKGVLLIDKSYQAINSLPIHELWVAVLIVHTETIKISHFLLLCDIRHEDEFGHHFNEVDVLQIVLFGIDFVVLWELVADLFVIITSEDVVEDSLQLFYACLRCLEQLSLEKVERTVLEPLELVTAKLI